VLTFSDISLQKQAQHEAEERSVYMRQILDTLDNSLIELDSDLRIVEANTAFYKQFQVEPDETVGYLLYDLGNSQWDIPDLRRLLSEIIPEQGFVEHYIVRHDFPVIGPKVMRLNARKIDNTEHILLVITDVSEPDTE
jgi:two-component system CheB/CheR fusion protein